MNIELSARGGIRFVHLSGPVAHDSAGLLAERLIGLGREGGRALVVDLSGVSRLSHAGVRALGLAARRLAAAGVELRLCGASKTTVVRLRSLLFRRVLICDATPEAALAVLGAGSAERRSTARTSASVVPLRPQDDAPITRLADAQAGTSDLAAPPFDGLVETLRAEYARFLMREGRLDADGIARTCGYRSVEQMRRQAAHALAPGSRALGRSG